MAKTVVLVDICVFGVNKEIALLTFKLISQHLTCSVLDADDDASYGHRVKLETLFVVDAYDPSGFGEDLQDAIYCSMARFLPDIAAVRCLNVRHVRGPLPFPVLVRLNELQNILLRSASLDDPRVARLMSKLNWVNMVHSQLGVDMQSVVAAASWKADIAETLEELGGSEVLNTEEPWRTWVAASLTDQICLLYVG